MEDRKKRCEISKLNLTEILENANTHFVLIKGQSKDCFNKALNEVQNVEVLSGVRQTWNNKRVSELFSSNSEVMKQYLTAVGLAEYSYFSRFIDDLTMIERIKLFLAQCLEKRPNIIYIDQWTSHESGKEQILSCFLNILKVSKKNGLHIIVNVENTEDEKLMFPDLVIEVLDKGLCSIERIEHKKTVTDIIMDEMEFKKGTLEDYKQLEQYHYIKLPDTDVDYICCATYKGIVASIVIYISPIREIGMDNIKKNKIFEYILNNIVCCSRIVTNPHFRGLGVTGSLIRYGINKVPCKVMECRSSMLNNTNVLKQWGGVEVTRDYRKDTPCYDALEAYLKKWNVSFNENWNPQFIETLEEEELGVLSQHILSRLREIDQYQWRYYEQLVRMSTDFSDKEYRKASCDYVEYYQKEYKNIPLIKLLEMCRKWDSAAYVFKGK